MSQNRTREENNESNNNTWGNWATGIAAAVGAVAVAAGAYYLASSSEEKPQNEQHQIEQAKQKEQAKERNQAKRREQARQREEEEAGTSPVWNYFTDILRSNGTQGDRVQPQAYVPEHPVITNLNGLLHDIYVRYIALKDEDFEHHYNVFNNIFYRLHEQMKKADVYYERYSSTVQFAGSHYDNLRINKPDEFDMDIIIGLPINIKVDRKNPENSDVVLEAKAPGFVQLKMGTQFQNLPYRDGEDWRINKTAYSWMDERKYLLRSRFTDWFKSVVNRAMLSFALNANGRRFIYVEGVPYTLRLSESGPAITLIIENTSTGFRLDVDLVPAFKFPEDRWPICKGYRTIPPQCKRNKNERIFMVVPKPMKDGLSRYDTDRSWRLALHIQERDLMYDTNHMRQAIRLIKKLRDSQGMDKIASYYIKTIFYLEAMEHENDPNFWSRTNPATLFTMMVKKFYQHLSQQPPNIPYFWNKDNNLIGHINRNTLTGYANKLKKVIEVLEDPSQYKQAAKYLLTPPEFAEYNRKYLHI